MTLLDWSKIIWSQVVFKSLSYSLWHIFDRLTIKVMTKIDQKCDTLLFPSFNTHTPFVFDKKIFHVFEKIAFI